MPRWILAFGLALWLSAAAGREAAPVAEDAALEARVQALAEQLRCLVCQNQNLADSHAELAIDLKNQVRDMVKRGQSDKEVVDYMVQRYGDFVLYNPPVKATTWLLWGGPFLLLGSGIGILFVKLGKRRAQAPAPLTGAERDAARRLLDCPEGEEA